MANTLGSIVDGNPSLQQTLKELDHSGSWEEPKNSGSWGPAFLCKVCQHGTFQIATIFQEMLLLETSLS